ncbi:MAG: RNA methyltransferase [Candidatus Limisoma sp.]
MELTGNTIKWVHSLGRKKVRVQDRCFAAEGTKCVLDTYGKFRVRGVFATAEWLASHPEVDGTPASRVQLDRMSNLTTATDVIAVYEMPDVRLDDVDLRSGLTIVLDGVQDPGNLGTIMRIADWFGIYNIVCSEGTVDVYNPKVVQATMGAISRVRVFYTSLSEMFNRYADLPVFGTFLEGENIYNADLSERGFIVMGNEGTGISSEVKQFATCKLLIPSWPGDVPTSESLNVGMATAIVVSEFRRRMR